MSKKIPVSKKEWMVDNGSIYTSDTEELKIDFTGKIIQVRNAIAFNVGNAIAHHICEIHNNSLNDIYPDW